MDPIQWSLVKQVASKVENNGPNVPRQTEAKKDGIINAQNNNFNKF